MSVATGARTAFEKYILDKQKAISKQVGKKDYQITPDEYNKAVVEFFGEIPVPSDAKQVISQSPTELIYVDSKGIQKRIFRNTDSNLGAETGRLETQLQSSPLDPSFTDALSNAATARLSQTQNDQRWLDALFNNATRLTNPAALSSIDPATEARLNEIKAATDAKLNQQFNDEAGQLVAQLFGKGVNRSSVAATQAGRVSQAHGLVQAQAESDAAQRELQIRQFLSQLGQGNAALAGEEFASGAQLSQQELEQLISALTNREVAGQQLLQGDQALNLDRYKFDKNYGLDVAKYETAAQAQRQAAHRSLISSIINGVAGIATSGISSLFNRGSSGGGGGGYSYGGTYVGE